MLWDCMAVGAGGFIGSVLRYAVSLMPFFSRHELPLQTLIVNVAGAFIIGFIAGSMGNGGKLDGRTVPQDRVLRRIHHFFDIFPGIPGTYRVRQDRAFHSIHIDESDNVHRRSICRQSGGRCDERLSRR